MSIPTPLSEGFDDESLTTVKEMMASPPITISSGTNLHEAVKIMNEKRIGSIIVTSGKRPIGIVTERDIMVKVVGRVVSALDLSVSDVMSSPVRAIEEDASLESATRLMMNNRIRRLVVVNKSGELVGIITATDIVRELPETLSHLSKRIGSTRS